MDLQGPPEWETVFVTSLIAVDVPSNMDMGYDQLCVCVCGVGGPIILMNYYNRAQLGSAVIFQYTVGFSHQHSPCLYTLLGLVDII